MPSIQAGVTAHVHGDVHAGTGATAVGILAGDLHVHHPTLPPRPVVTTALPRDTADFVGRDQELQRILDTAAPGRVVSIHTIDGMPGVGKTALVVHAAHRLADQFPDGRYFIDLHTHTPGQHPAEPAEVLARLLTDLGIDPRYLPDSLDARRDLWRDRMAGKQALLVLDDARDHAQVEHLLPPGQACLTLITSRRRLIALDGAVALALDVLPPDTAADLFIALTRRDITDADQAAVDGIVESCGFLPLAIVLLAGRLAHHPAWTVAGLAAEFAATQDRLGELEAGQRAVRAAFTMSYQDLPTGRQTLFRRLGLHPGTDLDHYAAAALAGIPLDSARREVEALYTDHLLEETTAGRYRLHDLLRTYARSLITTDSAVDTGEAVDRLLDYYQDTATTADRRLARRTPTPLTTLPSSLVRDFADEQHALGWMRRERANLLACLEHASTHQPARMVALTGLLAGLLERDGPWRQARQLHQRAAATAQHLGDRLAHATALVNLGVIHHHTGAYSEAAHVEQQALTIFQQIGDHHGEANALVNLGLVHQDTGAYGEAADVEQQALTIFQQIGNRLGQAEVLNTLGLARWATGAYGEAADLYRQALTIYQEIGDDHRGEASALVRLGLVHQDTGAYGEAADVEQQALTIFQQIGNRLGQAEVLNTLGLARWATGAYGEAADLYRQALTIFREIGNRLGEANALVNLGLVHQDTGAYGAAVDVEQRALTIFREIGNRVGEANTLNTLGLARWATGVYGEAADLYRQALTIYREIGNRLGEANALVNLGLVHQDTGAYGAAVDVEQRALTIFREIGNRVGEANTLNTLGLARWATGAYSDAADLQRQALAIYQEIGNRLGEANALGNLALTRWATDAHGEAADLQQQALTIFREIGDRLGQAHVLNGIGSVLLATGAPDRALGMFTDALDLARDIGSPLEQARALEGTARSRAALGDIHTALARLREAVEIYRHIGAPETHAAATYLATLESG